MNDLEAFEGHVVKPLVETLSCPKRRRAKPRACAAGCTLRAAAAAPADPRPLARALTHYVIACTFDDALDIEPRSLPIHINNVSGCIKGVFGSGAMHAANWQDHQPAQVEPIIKKLEHELNQSPLSTNRFKRNKPDSPVLNEDDMRKLVQPGSKSVVQGTRQQLEERLQQLGTKASSISSTILLSVRKRDSLARSLHATADAVLQLADTARALKDTKKPVESKRIEENANEMCLATYNLMRTSETTSRDLDHPGAKRRLLEACHQLNDSINKLVRSAADVGAGAGAGSQCGSLSRALQLRAAALQLEPQPALALPYVDCLATMHDQRDLIQKLNGDQAMTREQLLQELSFVASAVNNSTECAAHCAYLLSVSEKDESIGKEGLVDVPKLCKLNDALEDTCISIIQSRHEEDLKEHKKELEKQVQELLKGLDEAGEKTKSAEVKPMLKECREEVDAAVKELCKTIDFGAPNNTTISQAMRVLAELQDTGDVLEHRDLVPVAGAMSADTQALCNDVLENSRTLLTKTQDLIREVNSAPEEPDVMKWVMFTKRKSVIDAFEAMLKSVRASGERVKFLESTAEETEGEQKSYMEIQMVLVKKWLLKPIVKTEVKIAGQQAVTNIIDVANKMTEDMSASEKEELGHLITETKQLLKDCSAKYDQEQCSLLLDRVHELQKLVERGVVTRVVEDFMGAEEPLQDLDVIADAERDESKRKLILERKIAELLAQLGRVTRTARLLAHTGSAGDRTTTQLTKCSEQTELLAPMLVKAAEERINSPNDKAVIEKYKALLAKYSESLAKVRDLCDQSVDPMDFVQTAGETMQRMREESSEHNDPMKCAHTSNAITKLANRVVHVGMSSRSARADPELARALAAAQLALEAAARARDLRASRTPDWKDTTAQILRATGEVESVLGGESIFKKQPEPNQPIYNEALNLHVAIRDWSSRDNEIVAVAKRMAVLMAKLSDYMNKDKQRELLTTSKSIVTESHEVARLAKKLAHECTDIRIKTDLLKACERIPTISGQLKMLTTVKGSSLGHHGTHEDKEAMDMLVGNAQSLMISIQDVIKGAASASVKIMSQRGPRMKWVRKNYY